MNLLIIDDNKADIVLIQKMLEKIGDDSLSFESASSFTEGLNYIKNIKFDLVLLDLGLPESKGAETLGNMSKLLAEQAVIVLTGLSDEQIGIDAIKMGAQDFLCKETITAVLLKKSIRYAIERHKLIQEKKQLLKTLQDAVKNIQTLEGIIPICMVCKKIRDDKGYWEQVEQHVSRYTPAQFTHGICPHCKDKFTAEEETNES